ncbi:MAG: hypothetical protein AB7V39_24370, partial [Nitrospiraceae bacterium]
MNRFAELCSRLECVRVLAARIGADDWPTPAEVARAKLDSYRYRQSPTDQAVRQLTIAYELAREHVLAGGALPEAPSALLAAPEPEQRKPADPDAAAGHMERIAELLG